ncbi:Disease resistance-like protein DSC1 [Vitis vinifera]|uniref:Disease resistance-like protein DSC1 n=4 Tax=Vitis vinifera TaxID=29760 RepID=A0A438FYG4_VITVI|nr:Disease resistance-like protein DSC1 [Vitis vinifera]
MKLLDQITSYAQGLPLALKVLGCSLCDRNADYWTDMLNQLKKFPNEEIQEVLQISFRGLKDNEKDIFLDIACFFRGRGKTFVRKILESCGFTVVSGIENLIDKSLITLTRDNRLEMHDLLQEMGWQIVRKTSKEPGKRSRLWEQKDISHILKWETGAQEVEGIFFNLSGLEEMNFTTKAFSQMTNLRLLEIYRSNLRDTGGKMQCKLHISDDFKFHYDELRYLHWDEYPCESLPSDFESENLVHFCMPRSHLTQLWKGQKVFGHLEFVDVSYSQYLKKTPDFSRATNLEVLVLKGCTNLRKVHPSLGYLSKLILLNMENCINLEHLPSIRWLVSLRTFILSGCSKLEKLQEVPQHMPYLSKLCLDGTAITDFSGWSELGNFQENSGNLDCLSELNSDDSTIRQQHSSSVVLRNHNASPSSAPRRSRFISPHCTLTSLTYLNLSGTSIIHLPWNLERLSMLKRLELTNCRRLQALPVLPSSIECMNASNCTSLELISPQSVFKRFGGFLFGNCFKLRNCHSKMEHDVQSVASHAVPGTWRDTYAIWHPNVAIPFSTVFPGSEIPDWFRHHSQGHEINIEVPPDWYINSNFLGFALSAVMAPQHDSRAWCMYCDLDTHDLNSNSNSHRICSFFGSWTYQLQRTPIESDHVWLAYVPSFFSFSREKWSHIKFSFSSSGGCVVKSCGFCPVYIKGTSDEGDYSSGIAFDEPRRHAAKPSRISYQ